MNINEYIGADLGLYNVAKSCFSYPKAIGSNQI